MLATNNRPNSAIYLYGKDLCNNMARKLTEIWKESFSFLESETKKHTFIKYVLLLIVILGYFFYAVRKYGAGNGFLVTLLTWSFFVFCTPIADAGFLIDFPVRLITKMRMIHSEMMVWSFATILNLYAYFHNSQIYTKTIILQLFHKILSHPYPFWGIIFLSAAGTFLSIYFGDELLDVSMHKERLKYIRHMNKYKIIVFAFIIAMTLLIYNFLLNNLGINLPLF